MDEEDLQIIPLLFANNSFLSAVIDDNEEALDTSFAGFSLPTEADIERRIMRGVSAIVSTCFRPMRQYEILHFCHTLFCNRLPERTTMTIQLDPPPLLVWKCPQTQTLPWKGEGTAALVVHGMSVTR